MTKDEHEALMDRFAVAALTAIIPLSRKGDDVAKSSWAYAADMVARRAEAIEESWSSIKPRKPTAVEPGPCKPHDLPSANPLPPRNTKDDVAPPTTNVEKVVTALLIVGCANISSKGIREIERWTGVQLSDAYEWAMREHLAANDNDGVVRFQCPAHVVPLLSRRYE